MRLKQGQYARAERRCVLQLLGGQRQRVARGELARHRRGARRRGRRPAGARAFNPVELGAAPRLLAAHRSKAVRGFRRQGIHERGSTLELLNRRTAGSERLAL